MPPAARRKPPAGGASGVSQPLDPGTSIKGGSGQWYRIEHFIGAGGNAATYLVMSTSGPHRGVPFALKFFLRMADTGRREAFLNETEFLQQCDHPAVMRVFDHGTYRFTPGSRAPRYPFLVAEYLPRTLYQLIRAGTASMTERLIFATQLVSALAYLDSHDPPVVHRDIKPSNIFIKGSTCVLGDFGLLKRVTDVGEQDRELLKESAGVGMPYFYRSPDLVAYSRNQAPITTKSDVFQLGLVLTELFTGRNPALAPEAGDPLSDVTLERIRQVPSGHAGLIVPILVKMLEPDPDKRPAATELLDYWDGAFQEYAKLARDLNGTTL